MSELFPLFLEGEEGRETCSCKGIHREIIACGVLCVCVCVCVCVLQYKMSKFDCLREGNRRRGGRKRGRGKKGGGWRETCR